MHYKVYLRGDIQEGGACSELLPLSDKGKIDFAIDDQELFPDTLGLIKDKLLTIGAGDILQPGGYVIRNGCICMFNKIIT